MVVHDTPQSFGRGIISCSRYRSGASRNLPALLPRTSRPYTISRFCCATFFFSFFARLPPAPDPAPAAAASSPSPAPSALFSLFELSRHSSITSFSKSDSSFVLIAASSGSTLTMSSYRPGPYLSNAALNAFFSFIPKLESPAAGELATPLSLLEVDRFEGRPTLRGPLIIASGSSSYNKDSDAVKPPFLLRRPSGSLPRNTSGPSLSAGINLDQKSTSPCAASMSGLAFETKLATLKALSRLSLALLSWFSRTSERVRISSRSISPCGSSAASLNRSSAPNFSTAASSSLLNSRSAFCPNTVRPEVSICCITRWSNTSFSLARSRIFSSTVFMLTKR
mmetsp:Transcript_15022/g.24716  ORF Transcript_15022/g.24716 Transcript_15022/m.24716 type:complete len:338 (-) Transcript_15022:3205-4218(-)